ncbi:MAG: 7TM domain-containing protein [Candidatus Gracilibacteria bacterium]|nr:7TM domain-containing protein [Candidatus Gracilibacteria bacterium]
MRIKIFLVVFLVFLKLICFGDNEIQQNVEITQTQCIPNKYDISGIFDTKINNNISYSVNNNLFGEDKKDILKVDISITKDSKEIVKQSSQKITANFAEPGIYEIKANIIEDNSKCEYNFKKQINVFSKIITFISDKDDLDLLFDKNFSSNNIYFGKIILKQEKGISLQEEFLSKITDKLYIFQDSDIIIINSNNFLEILQGFEKISKIYSINFPNKKIFITTNSNFIFSKKVLSNSINTLNANVYTLYPANLLNFLNYLSKGNSASDMINNRDYLINKISFQPDQNNILFLTNFTNELISKGFSISILGIIFSLGVIVTLLNFVRQFIGISIFSLYYPILLSLSFYLFDFNLTLIFLVCSLIGIILSKIIYSKVHFLLNAKLSIFFVIYLMIFILISGLLTKYISFAELKSNLIIFPFIIIPMIIYKITDEKKIFSFGFFIYLGEFVLLSFLSYFTLSSVFIQNLFLSYTELIIVLILINFLIGKFSGLQIVEYIRFIPLIKKHFSKEEE